MADPLNNKDRDRRALELYEKVLEIEQRLIPTGLHVFGRAPSDVELADMLGMVASFDRPELGIRSLKDLVAEGLGLPAYSTLIKEGAESEEKLRKREQVEWTAPFVNGRPLEQRNGICFPRPCGFTVDIKRISEPFALAAGMPGRSRSCQRQSRSRSVSSEPLWSWSASCSWSPVSTPGAWARA